MLDTFSANSLKLLDLSLSEFKNKYIENLELIKTDETINKGNRLHQLIYYYIKGFDIEKIEQALDEKENSIWIKLKTSNIMNFILNSDKKFVEQPFIVKEELNSIPFYLTGRFDIVVQNGDKFSIIDWKTKNLPKNIEEDIQTITYFNCAAKFFKTKNIEMTYYSIENEYGKTVLYKGNYIDKIRKIVSKILL